MCLSDVIIVLSRPAEAGNVGAVCRAMKNMGLSRLRLVAPELEQESENIIRARAIHAVDIWENARTFDSLAAAVEDCCLVVGTTQRRGERRKQSMTPPELAGFLKTRTETTALVFGNERAGLSSEEINICNFASHIPAKEEFPSLNLSHAVLVYAYELSNLSKTIETVKGQWVPLPQKAINLVVQELTEKLKKLGFYKQGGRQEQERFFRDVISRAGLTKKEAAYFAEIVGKAGRLSSKASSEHVDSNC